MSAGRLYGRAMRLTAVPRPKGPSVADALGVSTGMARGFDLSGLDCAFKVKKNLKREPNTASIEIRNINPASRAALNTADRIIVSLEAGYVDDIHEIYRGELRRAVTTHEGPTTITKMETGDSEKEMQSARINLSVGKGTPASVVLAALINELGFSTVHVPTRLNLMTCGPTLYFGYAANVLDDFLRSYGYEWSVQDGVIQILPRGAGLNAKAVVLSSDSGLIESPTIDHKGVVNARALIQPGLMPGLRVQINAKEFSGLFRISECEIVGDTASTEWYVDFTAKTKLEASDFDKHAKEAK